MLEKGGTLYDPSGVGIYLAATTGWASPAPAAIQITALTGLKARPFCGKFLRFDFGDSRCTRTRSALRQIERIAAGGDVDLEIHRVADALGEGFLTGLFAVDQEDAL